MVKLGLPNGNQAGSTAKGLLEYDERPPGDPASQVLSLGYRHKWPGGRFQRTHILYWLWNLEYHRSPSCHGAMIDD